VKAAECVHIFIGGAENLKDYDLAEGLRGVVKKRFSVESDSRVKKKLGEAVVGSGAAFLREVMYLGSAGGVVEADYPV
jgi:hypothetical protein